MGKTTVQDERLWVGPLHSSPPPPPRLVSSWTHCGLVVAWPLSPATAMATATAVAVAVASTCTMAGAVVAGPFLGASGLMSPRAGAPSPGGGTAHRAGGLAWESWDDVSGLCSRRARWIHLWGQGGTSGLGGGSASGLDEGSACGLGGGSAGGLGGGSAGGLGGGSAGGLSHRDITDEGLELL